MTKYREILRLKSLNFSERNIALSCSCSRNTVARVAKRANELDIQWPLNESLLYLKGFTYKVKVICRFLFFNDY